MLHKLRMSRKSQLICIKAKHLLSEHWLFMLAAVPACETFAYVISHAGVSNVNFEAKKESLPTRHIQPFPQTLAAPKQLNTIKVIFAKLRTKH
jgi:hypothetical protein